MKAVIRRKLSMAAQAMAFSEANPAADAGYQAIVARLQDRLSRADVLAIQQRDGLVQQHGAVAHREELRRTIQQLQLRHLVRVAEMGVRAHPELEGQFVYPVAGGPERNFLTAAKAMLAAVIAQKDLFVTLGLGQSFIDELTKGLADYDASVDLTHASGQAHVGARAELATVAEECVILVGVLDGFNRARFADDPQSLAAWASASNVVAPVRSRQQIPVEPTPSPVPSPDPAVPVAGGDARAAA